MKTSIMRKWSILFGAVVIATVIANFIVSSSITLLHHSWDQYQSEVAVRQELISAIRSQFGYGGAIHNFKNYVLRGQDKYMDRFEKNLETIHQLFIDYKKIEGVTPEELNEITAVEETLSKYKIAASDTSSFWKQGIPSHQIDQMIKINDAPALEALKYLSEHYYFMTTNQTDYLSKYIGNMNIILFFIVIAMTVVFILLGLELKRSILLPVLAISEVIKKVSNGDLRQNLKLEHQDEIGRMASGLNKLVDNLSSIAGSIIQNADILSSTSKEMTQSSAQVNSSSEEISKKSSSIAHDSDTMTQNIHAVANTAEKTSINIFSTTSSVEDLSSNINMMAAASEESSANMGGINQNIEQISSDINSVSTTIEEMSETLGKINKNTKEAMTISSDASESAQEAFETMNQLGDTAGKIDHIVKLIDSIASQTNMLALNATIEAASAGEAGKGFAVVASEVKDLARQTAEANSEIAQQVEKIQQQSSEALTHTQKMNQVIHQVSELNHQIDAELDEQSKSSTEIFSSIESIAEASRESSLNVSEATKNLKEVTRTNASASIAARESAQNVTEAASWVQDIAHSIADTATVVKTVNESIQGIQLMIKGVNDEASQTQHKASALLEMADSLKKTANFFKLDIHDVYGH